MRPVDVVESTLGDALAGRFSWFQAVEAAPDWVGASLEPNSRTARDLHGSLFVFNWEDYGWSVGRICPTSIHSCNFGGLYAAGWRQDHTLTMGAYSSTGGHGSWSLLQPTHDASPILGYEGGKYEKRVGGESVWMRASADGMLHHTGEELKRARDSVKRAAEERREELVEEELDASAVGVGDKVFAQGRAPGSGEMEWFEAVVLGKRSWYPPLKVHFLKTMEGSTEALSLPTPQSCHVASSHVRKDRPE